MNSEQWDETTLPRGVEDEAWELLHENSKTSRFEAFAPEATVVARMQEFYESLPYGGYPEIELPSPRTVLDAPIGEVIARRVTSRAMQPCPLTFDQLGILLFNAYGITRDNEDTEYPRPFRIAPSGGGLYPLEVFFHTAHVEGLKAGLYHYQPERNSIRRLRDQDETLTISRFLVQEHFAYDSSVMFFLTAVFERSIFKYGNRGYRFVLMEAGHVAQNLILTATAMDLGTAPIGGFFDREADDFLELDGLRHSTLYLIAIGRDTDRG